MSSARRTGSAIDDEIREFWDRVADDWHLQVGDDGDENRRLNSDPVLWNFIGAVTGLAVLDAGCGTGYLSRQLHAKGAHVTGVDSSPRMIEIARRLHGDIEFVLDSCATLESQTTARYDIVVSNYVLMDTPHLRETMLAFCRVLKPGGIAVLVFSHPCFPQGDVTMGETGASVRYDWSMPYFKPSACVDPAWGHFQSDFIWFHRPLSDYWKAFKAAGFNVIEFEEPRINEPRYHLAKNERSLRNNQLRPFSVAFQLQRAERRPS